MSTTMNTILLIGGTSGIGEASARRFHSMGKQVIITGRRENRLAEIKKSLNGIETYHLDPTDFQSLPGHIEKLFNLYPKIDTVWVNAGVQFDSDIKDFSSTTDEHIQRELNIDVAAPAIIGHHVIPRLLQQKFETAFMITSSGIGFVPNGMFPVYSAAKAAVHAYCVAIRQSLKDTNVNVAEIVPPMVGNTDLGDNLSEALRSKMSALTPLPMEDFIRETFDTLGGTDGKDLKEVPSGTARQRVDAWRSGIGEILKNGMGG